MSNSLSAQDLAVTRGDRCLFHSQNFTLRSGELLLIEGPNGSGKTSMLRAIAGLIDLEEGQIGWNGQDVKAARQAYHSELVWMGHQTGFKGDLTLMENLRFESGLRAMSLAAAQQHLLTLGLAGLTDIPFRVLSAGQQRRVALARMIMAEAALWLMDEPFTNMDAAGQNLIVDVLQQHLEHGGMCAMASHRRFELDAKTVHRIELQ